MKIARCQSEQGIHYGIILGEEFKLFDIDPFTGEPQTGAPLSLSDVKLLAPCLPSKIVAYGINYAQHASEINFDIPKEPLLFLKPSTTVIGPDDFIMLPSASTQVEYEGELAVVIGKITRNVDPATAMQSVFGYTCLNDVTARDLQKKDIQFTRSKSFDTFAPLGPWIETDLDPADLIIETYVNNEKRQSGNTSDMIRSVPELVSFASGIMTLLPGDVIATGTPAGVGKLQHGDTVSITIDKIGTLTNKVLDVSES